MSISLSPISTSTIPHLSLSSAGGAGYSSPEVSRGTKEEVDDFYEEFGAISQSDGPSLRDVAERIRNNLGISKKLELDCVSNMKTGVNGNAFINSFGMGSFGRPDPAVQEKAIKERISDNKKFFGIYAGKGFFETPPFERFSFLENMKLKYRFYRGEFRERTIDQIAKIFADHTDIVYEFENRLKDSKHPLQDLRDFGKRLQVMDEERINLELGFKSSIYAHNHFLQTLSFFERTIFKIISFFHGFINPIQNTELSSLPKPKNFSSFNQPIIIAETVSTTAFYAIFAKLDAYDGKEFDGTITLSIKDVHKKTLGKMTVKREWRDVHKSCKEHTERSLVAEVGSLKNRKLKVIDFSDDFGQVAYTGELPVTQLLTQIAVEIFQRESETILTINACHNVNYVLFSGGFSGPFDKSKVLEEVSEARKNNMLFPKYKNLGGLSVSIHKMIDKDEANGTHFAEGEGRNNTHALVDFEIGTAPISWEKLIEKQRLLYAGNGPVLPRYIIKRFSQYEV